MRTRQIVVAAASGLATLARASIALAHSGGADDGRLLSLDSLALAIMTSLVVGTLCFVVMVWDPQTRHK
jgi:hypothetical protein